MQFSTIFVSALLSAVALAAPAPEAKNTFTDAEIMARAACRDGTYACIDNTPKVCQFGIWMVAAVCGKGQTCVQTSVGGTYCI